MFQEQQYYLQVRYVWLLTFNGLLASSVREYRVKGFQSERGIWDVGRVLRTSEPTAARASHSGFVISRRLCRGLQLPRLRPPGRPSAHPRKYSREFEEKLESGSVRVEYAAGGENVF